MTWRMSCALSACLIFLGVPHSAVAQAQALATDAPTLTLARAVSAALKSNPELQAFQFQIRSQDARRRQAMLRPAPELSLEVENFLGTGEFRGADSLEATLALSQVIELGSKREARIAAAEAGRTLIDIDLQARQLDVLAEVTRRLIDVASAQERLRLAERGRQLAQQTITATKKRVNAAKSPHAELDRARVALIRAELAERRAETALKAGRHSLAAMWGEGRPLIDSKPFGAAKADLYALPATGDFNELLARLDASPDFLRFASEARLKDAELRVAASLRKPDFTIGAGVRRAQASRDDAFVAAFSFPLFSGRRADAYVVEAEAGRDAVRIDREIARVRAQATLFGLHQELRAAVLEAQTLTTDALPVANEALKETEYAYQRGRYGYLELVDAQHEYLELQNALIDAATDAHRLRAEIERLSNAPLNPDSY